MMDMNLSPASVDGTLYLANTIYPYKIKTKDASMGLYVDDEQIILDENQMAVLKSNLDYASKAIPLTTDENKDFFAIKRRFKLDEMKKSRSTNVIVDKAVSKKHAPEDSTILLTCLKVPFLSGQVYPGTSKGKSPIQLGLSHNVLKLYSVNDKLQEPFDAYPLSSNVSSFLDENNPNFFKVLFPKITLIFEALTSHQSAMWVSLLNTSCLYLNILEESLNIDVNVLERTYKSTFPDAMPVTELDSDKELELLNTVLNDYNIPPNYESHANPVAYDFFAILPSPKKAVHSPADAPKELEILMNLQSDEYLANRNSEKRLSRLTSMVSEEVHKSGYGSLSRNSIGISGNELRSVTIEEDAAIITMSRHKSKPRNMQELSPISLTTDPIVAEPSENFQNDEILKMLMLFPDQRIVENVITESTPPEEQSNQLHSIAKIDDFGRPTIIYTVENYERGILACSLDVLIDLLANQTKPAEEYWLWLSFLNTPVFTSCLVIMKRFIARINTSPDGTEEQKFTIRVRLLRALFHWYEWFPNDFKSAEMDVLYTAFLNLISKVRNEENSRKLSNTCEKLLTEMNHHKDSIKLPGTEILPREYSPQLFAQEYTKLDFYFFSRISPKEFIYQLHTKDREAIMPLMNAISFFNKMTLWFANCYENEISDAKLIYIEWLVLVAKEFEYLNNFNGLMAAILAWNQLEVTATSEELGLEIKRLEDLMSFHANYKNYRTSLEQTKTPCIPFLGLFIKDLYLIEEYNSSMIDNLINISKLNLISERCRRLKIWQSVPYKFHDSKEGLELYSLLESMKNTK